MCKFVDRRNKLLELFRAPFLLFPLPLPPEQDWRADNPAKNSYSATHDHWE